MEDGAGREGDGMERGGDGGRDALGAWRGAARWGLDRDHARPGWDAIDVQTNNGVYWFLPW